MNRRAFLKAFTTATVAGLFLPEKKIWALDQTMIISDYERHLMDQENMVYDRIGAMEWWYYGHEDGTVTGPEWVSAELVEDWYRLQDIVIRIDSAKIASSPPGSPI